MAYPTFPKPSTLFSGTIDYPAASILCDQMYSYLNSQGDCCATIPRDALYKLDPLMTCIMIDSPAEQNLSANWQKDIKTAYYLMYQYL